MSRRQKVESWLGSKPRRILVHVSRRSCHFSCLILWLGTTSESDEESHNSSGFSSILPSNMSLLTACHDLKNSTIGTQVDEDDLLHHANFKVCRVYKSKINFVGSLYSNRKTCQKNQTEETAKVEAAARFVQFFNAQKRPFYSWWKYSTFSEKTGEKTAKIEN